MDPRVFDRADFGGRSGYGDYSTSVERLNPHIPLKKGDMVKVPLFKGTLGGSSLVAQREQSTTARRDR